MSGLRNGHFGIRCPRSNIPVSGPVDVSGFAWQFRHRFNGADLDTTVANDEIGGRAVTLASGALLTSISPLEGATSLALNGVNQAATMVDEAFWAPAGPFSLAIKARMNILSGTLFANHNSAASNKSLWFFHGAGGGLSLSLSFNGTTDGLTLTSAAGLLTTAVNYELACDRADNGDIRLYLNGVMVAKANSLSAISAAGVLPQLGARGTVAGGTNQHNGALDDFRYHSGSAFCGSDTGYIVI